MAIKPLTSDETMRQSPRPSGTNSGATPVEITARMLARESSTMLRPKSNLLRNHTTIVATRMTENARCRKSLAFSHSSCATLRGLGSR